jgi:DNA-binding NarL/FixJ family response regulator
VTKVLLFSDGEPSLAKQFESQARQIESFDLLSISGTVTSLLDRMSSDQPDVLLIDVTPQITLAALSEMKHAMSHSKVVLWGNSISTEFAFQAMGLGVRGILRKNLPIPLQVKCLQRVQAGELWFEKALADSFFSARRVALTQREGQLIVMLAQGLKNKEIATGLMISEGTVKVYVARLLQKTGVKDRFELALFGRKNLTANGDLIAAAEFPYQSQPVLRSFVLHKPAADATSVSPLLGMGQPGILMDSRSGRDAGKDPISTGNKHDGGAVQGHRRAIEQAPESSAAYYVWRMPRFPVAVSFPLSLIDRLEKDAVDTFRSLCSRGSEIGGLLIGELSPGSPMVLSIDDYDLIPCDYSRGPLYRLCDADMRRIEQAIQRRLAAGRRVAGFFRSHTRKGISLDAEDLTFFQSRFRDPHQIALLIRPFATKSSEAAIFVWENGDVDGVVSPLVFPFSSRALRVS